MKQSIWKISQAIDAILEKVEENGGEITQEELEALDINYNNLNEKIEDYCQVINMYTSDIECCSKEKSRINSIQQRKKNIVDRLKTNLLEAVLKYGNDGKKGNKVIELPTRKLYTVNRKNIQVDEERANFIIFHWTSYIRELIKEGIFEISSENNIDILPMIDAVNELCRCDWEETHNTTWVPFNENDLAVLNYNITFNSNLLDMVKRLPEVSYLCASDNISKEYSLNVNSRNTILDPDKEYNICKVIETASLTIK